MRKILGPAGIQSTETYGTSGGSTWQSITLSNLTLSKMVEDIESTGLGSRQEIYLSIIPPLSTENKLPQAEAIIERARKHAKPA